MSMTPAATSELAPSMASPTDSTAATSEGAVESAAPPTLASGTQCSSSARAIKAINEIKDLTHDYTSIYSDADFYRKTVAHDAAFSDVSKRSDIAHLRSVLGKANTIHNENEQFVHDMRQLADTENDPGIHEALSTCMGAKKAVDEALAKLRSLPARLRRNSTSSSTYVIAVSGQAE